MSTGRASKRDEPLRSWGDLDDEYEIVRELGRGGTAVVYLARDRELGRDVAIKVIRSTYVEDEEAVARLLREAQTVANLQHPNVVMLYGTRRLEDNSLALVMQYVPGEPLKDRIRTEGPMPFKMTTAILEDVAKALAYAHRHRIVHRDIKPENIYLDEEVEVARLADFGIARQWDRDAGITLPGMAIGTPTYMSPEQIDGGHLDGRSDLYSLGIVGYEMLTGQQPWAGENLYSIIYKQKREQLPPLSVLRPGIPDSLKDAIEGALKKNPTERWASAEDFLAKLRGEEVEIPEAPVVVTVEDLAPGVSDSGVDEGALTIRYQRPTEEELVAAVSGFGSDQIAIPGGPPTTPERLSPGGWLIRLATAAVIVLGGGYLVSQQLEELPLDAVPGALTEGQEAGTAAAAGEPTGTTGGPATDTPTRPTAMSAAGGDGQAGEPGTLLPDAVRLRVSDESGQPVGSALVEFRIRSGGGTVSPRFTSTDPEGFAQASWTLGSGVAPDEVEARLPGSDGPVLVFRARPPAGPAPVPAASPPPAVTGPAPATLLVLDGNGLQAAVSTALPDPVRIDVLDAEGEPITGVVVEFSLEPGNGSVAPATATSDEQGRVEVAWTLGERPSENQLRATVAGGSGVVATISATAIARSLRPRPGVVSGGTHSCALDSSGQATCWGGNDRGQLGDGGSVRRSAARSVAGELQFAEVATGVSFTCGVTLDGSAFCWGANDRGQLGDGTSNRRNAPTSVAGARRFRSIRAGLSHTCARSMSNRVVCWGGNDRGQVGDGGSADQRVPAEVAGGRAFTDLSVGWDHTCGLVGGQVYCWGANDAGQLGTGSTSPRNTPTLLPIRFSLVALAAGRAHTCGVSRSGVAYCWGSNSFGQVGDGSTSEQLTPVAVAGDNRFTSLAAGAAHSCGLTNSGQAYCWGRNNYGQLGDGTTSDRSEPALVSGGLTFTTLSATGAHTCGRATNGAQYCWGYNSEGQLGDGSRSNRNAPARVSR